MWAAVLGKGARLCTDSRTGVVLEAILATLLANHGLGISILGVARLGLNPQVHSIGRNGFQFPGALLVG